jgi:PadR family transcriptional regulator, regulatory protein PadR
MHVPLACAYRALRSSVRTVAAQTGRLDTTQLLKGVLDVVVLAALADADGYGYDVVRRLRATGLGDIGDASVYGTLRRLFGDGLLSCYVVPSDEGPHRKYYALSALGRKALEQQRTSWMSFAATVHRILDGSLLPEAEQ